MMNSVLFLFEVDVLLNEAELQNEISRIRRRLNPQQLNDLSVTQQPNSVDGEFNVFWFFIYL
jgi:hypothetical protein